MVEELLFWLFPKCQAKPVPTYMAGKQLKEYKILLLLLDSYHHWSAYFVANGLLSPKTCGLASRAGIDDQTVGKEPSAIVVLASWKYCQAETSLLLQQ